MKKCGKCRKKKPASEYHKNKNTADGLKCFCKACSKIERKKWVSTIVDETQLRSEKERFAAILDELAMWEEGIIQEQYT